jgi:hypothetical protein
MEVAGCYGWRATVPEMRAEDFYQLSNDWLAGVNLVSDSGRRAVAFV